MHFRTLPFRLIFSAGFLSVACSSAPPKIASDPDWIHAPARTVDSGYNVYVGKGEDVNAERAQFKAESAALLDLANECSFVPKGARLEDRFEHAETGLHTAFAKVAVEFQGCEEAKKAIQPEQVRTLANAAMTEQIKKYQDMLGEQPAQLSELAADDAQAAPSPSASATPSADGVTRVPFRNDFHFFVVRQQIAYEKQAVILAPPTAYQASAPETSKYLQNVQAPSANVTVYEKSNPQLMKSPATWSEQRRQVAPVISQPRPTVIQKATPGKAPPKSYPKPAKSTQGRRKRRHW